MTHTSTTHAPLADNFAKLTIDTTYNFRTANGDSHIGLFDGYDPTTGDVTVAWASSWLAGANAPTELDDDHDAVLLHADKVTEVLTADGDRVY